MNKRQMKKNLNLNALSQPNDDQHQQKQTSGAGSRNVDTLNHKAKKALDINSKDDDGPNRPVWCSNNNYRRLKFLTFEHDHTTILHWVNKAVNHAFNDGTLK